MKILNSNSKNFDKSLDNLLYKRKNKLKASSVSVTKIIEMAKGSVALFIFVINLFDLGGCDKLIKSGYKVENLIEFPGH